MTWLNKSNITCTFWSHCFLDDGGGGSSVGGNALRNSITFLAKSNITRYFL